MAVQAQYPSNIFHLKRNLQDGKNMNDSQTIDGDVCGGFLDQSHMDFHNNGAGINQRKRVRETTTTTNMNSCNQRQVNNHQRQQQHRMINLSQLQNSGHNNNNNGVSTGLRLSFGEQQQQNNDHDFSLLFKHQSHDLNYFIHSQTEQLRRTLADKRQKHYRALLAAAEEATTRQLKEKEIELERATTLNIELMGQAAQLTQEAQTWRARVEAQEAQAAQLQAQIHQTLTNTPGAQQQGDDTSGLKCTGGDAEDSESVYIDPGSERRVDPASCRVCRSRAASVVLLPCRHLCVCSGCGEGVECCPVCFVRRSANVEIFFC